jgi:hypothetical protein
VLEAHGSTTRPDRQILRVTAGVGEQVEAARSWRLLIKHVVGELERA